MLYIMCCLAERTWGKTRKQANYFRSCSSTQNDCNIKSIKEFSFVLDQSLGCYLPQKPHLKSNMKLVKFFPFRNISKIPWPTLICILFYQSSWFFDGLISFSRSHSDFQNILRLHHLLFPLNHQLPS